MIERRELLQRWLREKGYHVNDIASALDFYDEKDPKPNDAEVRKIAETSHLTAIEIAKTKIGKDNPILVKYVSQDNVAMATFFSTFGSIFGVLGTLLLYESKGEILSWLVLVAMRLQLLVMG